MPPYYWILIHNAKKHSSVILEVNHSNDNVETVIWHYLDNKTLKQKERQAINEGGLIPTLKSAAGNAIDDLSFTGKVSESSVSDKKDIEKVQPTVRENFE